MLKRLLITFAALVPALAVAQPQNDAEREAAEALGTSQSGEGEAAETGATAGAYVEPDYADGRPPTILRGRISRNEFIGEVIARSGASAVETDNLVQSLKGIYDFRKARPGHRYNITVDPDGLIQKFDYRAGVDEIYQVRRIEGTLVGERITVELEQGVVEVNGEITTSLWDAFVASGESPNLAMALSDVLAYDVDFYQDTRTGDRFRFYVEKYTHKGELVRYGRIYAAEYAGIPNGPVGTKRLFWYGNTKTKTEGYFDENGMAAKKAFLRSPLKYTHVTSRFGNRFHPVLYHPKFHNGVDYAAAVGTPVQAVADGTVAFAGTAGPAGKMVKLVHKGNYESLYMHLSKIRVRQGQHVSQKSIIGDSGATGRVTGPHLHFSLKQKGQYINPQKKIAPRVEPVPPGEKAQFKAFVAPYVEKMLGTATLAQAPASPTSTATP